MDEYYICTISDNMNDEFKLVHKEGTILGNTSISSIT